MEIKQKRQQNLYVLMIMGMIIGFVSFICIYGTKVLSVTYDAFLINQGADLTQNYLGWIFYRFSSAKDGIGMMNTLTYPNSVSMIYTDSIPLAEIILKPVSGFLPTVFQYWGWWGALSFSLSGGIAAVIIRRWTSKTYLIGISTLPFVLAVPAIVKMWVHHTFVAQWLLLLAFCIWLYHKDSWADMKWTKPVGCWFGMGILTCSIHFYFVPMIGIILVGYILNMLMEDKKRWKKCLVILFSYIMGALLFMIVFGGFRTNFYKGDTYFDEYIEALRICGANLNCFFNSWTPTVFGKLYEFATPGQGEGLAYLGVGMIAAVAVSVFVRLQLFKKHKGMRTPLKNAMIVVFIISVIVAIGPTVSFGTKVLFEIPYPKFMLEIWSTFRNTGRFIWPAFYLLLLFAVKTLLTMEKQKLMNGILIICCMIQIIDLFPTFIDRHEKYEEYEGVNTILTDEAWDIIGKRYEHSVVLPNKMLNRGNERNHFAYWAGKNEITLNDFYLARQILEDQTDTYLEKLREGGADKDTVYIVNRELLEKFIYCPLYWYQLDDFYVGTTENISEVLNKKAIDRTILEHAREKWIHYDVDYAAVFDPVYYYYRYYSDLQSEEMTAEEIWKDFINFGRYQARKASINFDPVKYRKRYLDISEACGDNWELYYWQYAGYGQFEDRIGN